MTDNFDHKLWLEIDRFNFWDACYLWCDLPPSNIDGEHPDDVKRAVDLLLPYADLVSPLTDSTGTRMGIFGKSPYFARYRITREQLIAAALKHQIKPLFLFPPEETPETPEKRRQRLLAQHRDIKAQGAPNPTKTLAEQEGVTESRIRGILQKARSG